MINPTRCKSGSSTLFPPGHYVRVLNTSIKLLQVNHTFLGLLKNAGIANLLELEFLWLLDSMSMARFHDSCFAVSYVGRCFWRSLEKGKEARDWELDSWVLLKGEGDWMGMRLIMLMLLSSRLVNMSRFIHS